MRKMNWSTGRIEAEGYLGRSCQAEEDDDSGKCGYEYQEGMSDFLQKVGSLC